MGAAAHGGTEIGRSRDEFDRLFRETRGWAFRIANRRLRNRDESDDVVQEAFLRAWNRFDSFDRGGSFQSWMYRILTNLIVDRARRRARVVFCALECAGEECRDAAEPADADVPGANPEARLLSRAGRDRLLDAILQLPAPLRGAMLLFASEGRSYREIARALHCSPGTVRSRIYRARRQLWRALENDPAFEGLRPPAGRRLAARRTRVPIRRCAGTPGETAAGPAAAGGSR